MSKKIIALTISVVMGISISTSIKANADIKEGWVNNGKGWSYYENGSIKSGWLNLEGNFYYLKDDGNMATGWININNEWYYMDKSGLMKTGWQKIDGTWYFMQDSGSMKIGWLKNEGKWYYLDKNGAMVSNASIDEYYLGEDGAWIENISQNDTTEGENNFKDIIMKTEKGTYGLGINEIIIDITNNSKKEIYYGLQYEVEKYESDKWIKVPFKEEPAFIEIAYALESGKTVSQVIPLSNLRELTVGKYRIVKSGGSLAAEFELK